MEDHITKGCRVIAHALDDADKWLIDILKELGELTDAQAQKAALYFIAHKLVKRDVPMRKYQFKHGALMDKGPIRIAAGIA